MGLILNLLDFETAAMFLRRRRHGRNSYNTKLGILLVVLAALIMIIGAIVTARKKGSEKNSLMNVFKTIALILVLLSVIVEILLG